MNLIATRRDAPLWSRLRLTGVLFGLLLSFAAHVPQANAAQDPAKANALFKRAKAKLEAGAPHEALQLVTTAAEYFAHPAIFLLKAKTLQTLGRYEKALAVLEGISARKLPSALRRTRARGIKASKAALAERGHIVAELRPPGVTAIVAGKRYLGAIDTWLPAGSHEIVVKAPGYQTKRKTVELTVGATVEVVIGLRKLVGNVRIAVAGGLKGVGLKLDGKPIPVSEGRRAGDIVMLKLPVGSHEVACSRGALQESHIVAIALGKTAVVSCSQIGGGPSRVVVRSLGWGGVVAGAALAGYGVWGLQSYFADMERAEKAGLIADTNKHYGGALYLASGLAISATSYLLFVHDSTASSDATALAPEATSPWRVSAR